MKINGKFAALAGAALLMGSAAFAQATDDYNLPQGFSFYNEVGSDTVEGKGAYYNTDDGHKNYQVEFAGIYEKVGISYSSEKFWFELAPKFALKDAKQHWTSGSGDITDHALTGQALNNDDLGFIWDGLDWGVRFTPFDIVDFVLKSDTWTAGGYLPIADQHVGGNLTGSGFGVVIKPIDGLRIGIEVPFGFGITSDPNYLDAEKEDTNAASKGALAKKTNLEAGEGDYKFNINAGVDYKLLDMVTVGAFVTDIVDRAQRGYGLYANAGIGFLDFNFGYTYNGDETKVSLVDFTDDVKVTIGGHHKANLAVGAAFGDLTVKMDALFNFFKAQSLYDLYAGLAVGYDLLPGKFNVGLQGRVAYDMGNKTKSGVGYTRYEVGPKEREAASINGFHSKKGSKGKTEASAPMIGIKPSMTYNTGKNTFNVAANLQYWLDGEGSYAASFPVSWKYTF